jgi:prolyl-tRNA synthetase
VRRDTGEKRSASLDTIGEDLESLLVGIQTDMLTAARDRREAHSVRGPISYDDVRALMEGEGAVVYAGWCGDPACEATIKEETKATIRVLPSEEFRSAEKPTKCLRCGRPALDEALWARAY